MDIRTRYRLDFVVNQTQYYNDILLGMTSEDFGLLKPGVLRSQNRLVLGAF